MKDRTSVVNQAIADRERLAKILATVRAKACDPNDPEQAQAAEMLLLLQNELSETDARLGRVGIMH